MKAGLPCLNLRHLVRGVRLTVEVRVNSMVRSKELSSERRLLHLTGTVSHLKDLKKFYNEPFPCLEEPTPETLKEVPEAGSCYCVTVHVSTVQKETAQFELAWEVLQGGNHRFLGEKPQGQTEVCQRERR